MLLFLVHASPIPRGISRRLLLTSGTSYPQHASYSENAPVWIYVPASNLVWVAGSEEMRLTAFDADTLIQVHMLPLKAPVIAMSADRATLTGAFWTLDHRGIVCLRNSTGSTLQVLAHPSAAAHQRGLPVPPPHALILADPIAPGRVWCAAPSPAKEGNMVEPGRTTERSSTLIMLQCVSLPETFVPSKEVLTSIERSIHQLEAKLHQTQNSEVKLNESIISNYDQSETQSLFSSAGTVEKSPSKRARSAPPEERLKKLQSRHKLVSEFRYLQTRLPKSRPGSNANTLAPSTAAASRQEPVMFDATLATEYGAVGARPLSNYSLPPAVSDNPALACVTAYRIAAQWRPDTEFGGHDGALRSLIVASNRVWAAFQHHVYVYEVKKVGKPTLCCRLTPSELGLTLALEPLVPIILVAERTAEDAKAHSVTGRKTLPTHKTEALVLVRDTIGRFSLWDACRLQLVSAPESQLANGHNIVATEISTTVPSSLPDLEAAEGDVEAVDVGLVFSLPITLVVVPTSHDEVDTQQAPDRYLTVLMSTAPVETLIVLPMHADVGASEAQVSEAKAVEQVLNTTPVTSQNLSDPIGSGSKQLDVALSSVPTIISETVVQDKPDQIAGEDPTATTLSLPHNEIPRIDPTEPCKEGTGETQKTDPSPAHVVGHEVLQHASVPETPFVSSAAKTLVFSPIPQDLKVSDRHDTTFAELPPSPLKQDPSEENRATVVATVGSSSPATRIPKPDVCLEGASAPHTPQTPKISFHFRSKWFRHVFSGRSHRSRSQGRVSDEPEEDEDIMADAEDEDLWKEGEQDSSPSTTETGGAAPSELGELVQALRELIPKVANTVTPDKALTPVKAESGVSSLPVNATTAIKLGSRVEALDPFETEKFEEQNAAISQKELEEVNESRRHASVESNICDAKLASLDKTLTLPETSLAKMSPADTRTADCTLTAFEPSAPNQGLVPPTEQQVRTVEAELAIRQISKAIEDFLSKIGSPVVFDPFTSCSDGMSVDSLAGCADQIMRALADAATRFADVKCSHEAVVREHQMCEQARILLMNSKTELMRKLELGNEDHIRAQKQVESLRSALQEAETQRIRQEVEFKKKMDVLESELKQLRVCRGSETQANELLAEREAWKAERLGLLEELRQSKEENSRLEVKVQETLSRLAESDALALRYEAKAIALESWLAKEKEGQTKSEEAENAEKRRLRAHVESLQQELSRLQFELTAVTTASESYKSQLHARQQKFDQAEQEWKQERLSAQVALDQSKSELSSLSQQIEDLQRELAQKEAVHQQVKTRLSEDLAQMQQAHMTAQQEIERLKAQIAVRGSDPTTEEQTNEEAITSLRVEIVALMSRLNELEAQNTRLEDELAQALSQKKELEAALHSVAAERSLLQSRIELIEQQSQEAIEGLKSASAREAEAAESTIVSLESQLTLLQERLDLVTQQLQSAMDPANVVGKESQSATPSHGDATPASKAFSDTVAEAYQGDQDEAPALRALLQERDEELTRLRAELQQTAQTIERIQIEAKEATQRDCQAVKDAWSELYDKVSQDNSLLQQALQEQKNLVNQREVMLKELAEMLQAQASAADLARQELAQVQAELNSRQLASDQQLASLQQELAQAQQQLQVSHQYAAQLQSEALALNTNVATLTHALATSKEEVAQLTIHVSNLKARIVELEEIQLAKAPLPGDHGRSQSGLKGGGIAGPSSQPDAQDSGASLWESSQMRRRGGGGPGDDSGAGAMVQTAQEGPHATSGVGTAYVEPEPDDEIAHGPRSPILPSRKTPEGSNSLEKAKPDAQIMREYDRMGHRLTKTHPLGTDDSSPNLSQALQDHVSSTPSCTVSAILRALVLSLLFLGSTYFVLQATTPAPITDAHDEVYGHTHVPNRATLEPTFLSRVTQGLSWQSFMQSLPTAVDRPDESGRVFKSNEVQARIQPDLEMQSSHTSGTTSVVLIPQHESSAKEPAADDSGTRNKLRTQLEQCQATLANERALWSEERVHWSQDRTMWTQDRANWAQEKSAWLTEQAFWTQQQAAWAQEKTNLMNIQSKFEQQVRTLEEEKTACILERIAKTADADVAARIQRVEREAHEVTLAKERELCQLEIQRLKHHSMEECQLQLAKCNNECLISKPLHALPGPPIEPTPACPTCPSCPQCPECLPSECPTCPACPICPTCSEHHDLSNCPPGETHILPAAMECPPCEACGLNLTHLGVLPDRGDREEMSRELNSPLLPLPPYISLEQAEYDLLQRKLHDLKEQAVYCSTTLSEARIHVADLTLSLNETESHLQTCMASRQDLQAEIVTLTETQTKMAKESAKLSVEVADLSKTLAACKEESSALHASCITSSSPFYLPLVNAADYVRSSSWQTATILTIMNVLLFFSVFPFTKQRDVNRAYAQGSIATWLWVTTPALVSTFAWGALAVLAKRRGQPSLAAAAAVDALLGLWSILSSIFRAIFRARRNALSNSFAPVGHSASTPALHIRSPRIMLRI